ncbi:MAG: 50S ribosomal protein L10 [Flavobacteriales bacterium]
MTREEKDKEIEALSKTLSEAEVIYLADTSGLSAGDTNALRKSCYDKNVSMKVIKNTLLKKALDKTEGRELNEFYDVISGPTSIMTSDVGNAPAKVIEEFRKTYDKPQLKGACIEDAVYIGDDNLKSLSELKSQNELIGDIVSLLQSPAKNVISALQSGNDKLAGIMRTLSDKKEDQ